MGITFKGGALATPAHDQPHRVALRHHMAAKGEDQELPEREDSAKPHEPARHELLETMAPPTRLRQLASVVADVKFIDGVDERETSREAA